MITISFVNMKGGVGKTTLAVNVADFLVKRHNKKVLLVDVDPQFNATQCVMDTDEYVEYTKKHGSTIIDVFNITKNSASVVNGDENRSVKPFETIIPFQSTRGFDVLPSKLDLFRFEMAPGQGTEHRLKNYLKSLSEKGSYDICIIDCPPTPSVWMTSAIISSDYYLIPSRPDPISMTGLDLLDSIIRERKDNYGCCCKCVGLVLTQVEKNTNIYTKAVEHFSQDEKWRTYLYEPVLLKRTSIAKDQLNGKFIYDIDDSELKLQFSNIVSEFLRRIGRE